MFKATIRLKDWMVLRHYRDGKLIYEYRSPDLVTAVGKSRIAGLINGVFSTAFTYIAIGTGTVTPSTSDTALGNEVSRSTASCSTLTTSSPGDTAYLRSSFSFSSSYAITETGVFNASSGGDMLCRQTFPPVNVLNGDGLEINWYVQVV